MALALLLTLPLLALPLLGDEPVHQTHPGGVAVEGYDVVAYFVQAKAVEGSTRFELEWSGATWRFASAANRDAFRKEPRRYAPQYGGFCAYGVSRGYAVGSDPEAWTIVDGKLYLNYDRDVQQTWLRDVPGHVAQADRNWPKIVAESKK